MEKEQIEKRILELKKENDAINQKLAQLDAERNLLISRALENNGRIKELELLLTK